MIVGWDAEPSDVAHHIHARPTLSETVGAAFLTLAGRGLLRRGRRGGPKPTGLIRGCPVGVRPEARESRGTRAA